VPFTVKKIQLKELCITLTDKTHSLVSIYTRDLTVSSVYLLCSMSFFII